MNTQTIRQHEFTDRKALIARCSDPLPLMQGEICYFADNEGHPCGPALLIIDYEGDDLVVCTHGFPELVITRAQVCRPRLN